jgi:hypothetical protein
MAIAQIEALPGGQFGIKVLRPIPVLDLCQILSQLVAALIQKNKNQFKIVHPDGTIPEGIEGR